MAMKAACELTNVSAGLPKPKEHAVCVPFANNSLNGVRLASKSWIVNTLIVIERKPVRSFC
ncbi:hypothetical protein QA645_07430 [Bradyrhizobium sp. CIAT3101]|uniref:hypothetical protein n=1 Tax=Bradyrhizobium sp. CIAT3101 TaxID=439387 RepID=UPI0024B09290|nr:hypothetical protein [Bradyrhizobium sp. CIAT3101]WFU82562.1 hypothetical protein QA645_07430 [Bradyrhizobium sp. CIAT3101]